MARNLDDATVAGFGEQWAGYDQQDLSDEDRVYGFNGYFGIFPFESLPTDAEGFDIGCGSGRWAALVAPKVGTLHCIDPAEKALAVAREALSGQANVRFHLAATDEIPLPDASQDFGYSLGVLHHIPDTRAALSDCVAKLKPGAPFLLYIYYAFDNRSPSFRRLWKVSDIGRRALSRTPFAVRKTVTLLIAAFVYWPLARTAKLAERLGRNVASMPLSSYRHTTFYCMKTDALDRFGTRLEQRFTKAEVEAMMNAVGLGDIRFSPEMPFWVACGVKAHIAK